MYCCITSMGHAGKVQQTACSPLVEFSLPFVGRIIILMRLLELNVYYNIRSSGSLLMLSWAKDALLPGTWSNIYMRDPTYMHDQRARSCTFSMILISGWCCTLLLFVYFADFWSLVDIVLVAESIAHGNNSVTSTRLRAAGMVTKAQYSETAEYVV